jgi:hypothetical protein
VHEYDVALKRILTRPGSALLAALTGSSSLRWLNVEAPKVNNRRVDLLGESPEGGLTHIELQARNEKHFPLRMAQYLIDIGTRYGRLPRQVALYVGEARLRMKNSLETPDLSFRFHMVDIRDMDRESLLRSENIGDNVISILTRSGGEPDAVRQILKRIAREPAEERYEVFAELLIVAGLRRLAGEVKREAKKMPIQIDIMDHEVIGPLIRQGRAEGRLEILLEMIEERFGSVSPRARKRLSALDPSELTAVGRRLIKAQRIEDLFAR